MPPGGSPSSKIGAFAVAKGLSPREEAVLVCMVEGMPIDDMADHLKCAVSTVKTYLHRLFNKTGRGSQLEVMGLLIEWLCSVADEDAQ